MSLLWLGDYTRDNNAEIKMRPDAKSFTSINSFVLPTVLQARSYYSPHFTDEEAGAQRYELTYPRPFSKEMAEPVFKLKPVRF